MIAHEEVAQKMKKASCFVLFSDMETQGIVLLEAFSSGIPVIATNVGGIPEIVENNRGILVDKSDENALFEAMENILLNKISFEEPEKIRQFVVNNFSKQRIAEQLTEIYNQVLIK